MEDTDDSWIAKLIPLSGRKVSDLLALRLSMDVWQRTSEFLLVSASQRVLVEIERQQIAQVIRIQITQEYERAARSKLNNDPSD